MNDVDIRHLQRCIELATEAVDAGDQPFGSILVSRDGTVLFEDRNRTGGGDATRHPEFAIARWSAEHLTPKERQHAVVYTSGEHCAMCAAAHGLVGLGRIVYATSTPQLSHWMQELGKPSLGISLLRLTDVVPDADVTGPVPDLADEVRALHARAVS